MRTSDWSYFGNLLANTWDAGHGEWNGGVLRDVRYEPGPVLYTSGNQVNSIVVYSVRGNGFAAVGGTITESLFVDGQAAGLSDAKIMELARIFRWDIDFALEIRAGDRFSLVYEQRFAGGEQLEDLLAF